MFIWSWCCTYIIPTLRKPEQQGPVLGQPELQRKNLSKKKEKEQSVGKRRECFPKKINNLVFKCTVNSSDNSILNESQ
jgi:hypothetical protein